MHAVGGVTHQRQARRDHGLGQMQRQRMMKPPAFQPDVSQEPTDPLAKLRHEGGIVLAADGGGMSMGFGPDDAAAPAGQRQDGEGSRRQEPLMGDAVMGLLMGHGADDAAFAIGAAVDGDPRRRAGRRCPAVGGHRQRGDDPAPVLQLDLNPAGKALQPPDPGRRQQMDTGRGGQPLQHAPAQDGIGDDPAQGMVSDLPVVVMQEQR